MPYTNGFKSRMIERMAGPEGVSANALSKEVDVCQSTLSRWLRDRSLGGMTEETGPRKGARPASEKLRIVLEAASLSDEDLGKLLRREGIHKADLEEWRTAMMQGLAPPKRKSSK